MARKALACLLLFLTSAVGLFGEEPPQDLIPGTRVRVTAPALAPKPLVGTIKKLSDDAIELAVKGRDDVISVPRASVIRLEVSQGRSGRKGALIGGATLATVGIVWGAVACHDPSSEVYPWVCATIMGVTGLGAGGGFGALVGLGERWNELPSDRFRVTLAPTPGRGVALSMRFTF